MCTHIKIEDRHMKEKGMIRVDLESDSIFLTKVVILLNVYVIEYSDS